MINKIAFTPAVSIAEVPEKEVNFTGLPKEETKEDNSGLLYGSLAVLGSFGIGMLIRKPKVVEKIVEKTVETAKTATEAAKTAAEAGKTATEAAKTTKKAAKTTTEKFKTKRKTRQRKELNIGGREKNMDKTDAKWQRKREKQLLNKQMQRESEEQFTEEELQTYIHEYGYQKPNAEQRQAIDALNKQNALERKEKNTLGNIAHKKEVKFPKPVVENPELKSLEGTINAIKIRIEGAKRFFKDTSKLEAQLNALIEKRDNLFKKAA